MTEVVLTVTVVPNSSATAIKSIEDNIVKILINKPPENNKANDELCKYLSKILKVKKSQVLIISGQTNRNKTVVVKNCESMDIIKLLSEHIK